MTAGVTKAVTGRDGMKIKKALPVEWLLWWAYGTELVRGREVTGEEPEVAPGDTSRARGGVCHDDALTIDLLVSQLAPDTAALVRDHAMAGTRPDWKPRARHRMAAVRWEYEGGARYAQVLTTHPSLDKRGKSYRFCPVIEVDRPDAISRVRRFYVHWFAGLEVIRNALRTHRILVDHDVTDALPPPIPWQIKMPVDGKIWMG